MKLDLTRGRAFFGPAQSATPTPAGGQHRARHCEARAQCNFLNITCAGCANKAGDILNKLPGVVSATADHVTRTADVEVVQGTLAQEDLLNALRPAGYGLLPVAA